MREEEDVSDISKTGCIEAGECEQKNASAAREAGVRREEEAQRSQQRQAVGEDGGEEVTREDGRKRKHRLLAQRRERDEEMRAEVWGEDGVEGWGVQGNQKEAVKVQCWLPVCQ